MENTKVKVDPNLKKEVDDLNTKVANGKGYYITEESGDYYIGRIENITYENEAVSLHAKSCYSLSSNGWEKAPDPSCWAYNAAESYGSLSPNHSGGYTMNITMIGSIEIFLTKENFTRFFHVEFQGEIPRM